MSDEDLRSPGNDDFPDWQDDEDGGLDYGDDQYAGGGGGGSDGGSSEEDYSSIDISELSNDGDGDEIDFKEGFGDRERTKGGALQAGGGILHGSKARRTAEDAAREKAEGIMSGENMYSALGLEKKEREKIINLILNTPHVERLAIEVYIPALLFTLRKLDPEKDFKPFFKKTEGLEAVDLLRYIRANPR